MTLSSPKSSQTNYNSDDCFLTRVLGVEGMGAEVGAYSRKFYTGSLRPEVQPLTPLDTILTEKLPLSYTLY